jgi:hypothetical protein
MPIRRLQILTASSFTCDRAADRGACSHCGCRDLVAGIGLASSGSMPPQAFEVLHRAFVLVRLFTRVESAQVAALAGDGVLPARIEPVLT